MSSVIPASSFAAKFEFPTPVSHSFERIPQYVIEKNIYHTIIFGKYAY